MKRIIRELSIQTQLIMLIGTVMVPLCLLLFISEAVSAKNMKEYILGTYQNELGNFTDDVENTFSRIDSENNILFSQYVTAFTMKTAPNRISRVHIMQDLANIWKRIDLVSAVALYVPESDEIYISHDRIYIDYEELQELQEMIRNMDWGNSGEIQLLSNEAGKNYYAVSFPYNVCHIVYVISGNALVDNLKEKSYGDHVKVFLIDEQGEMVASSENDGADMSSLQGKYILKQKLPYIGHEVMLALERSCIAERVPFSMRMLRSVCVAAVILLPCLWVFIRCIVLEPMKKMSAAMEEVQRENLDYRLDWNEAGSKETRYMEETFNKMAAQIQNLRIEKYETELKKRDIEEMNLRLQINPHLLLNSINMIYSLAQMSDCATIQKYAMNLSNYFRYTLRNTAAMVGLEEEINFVKSYLEIQKIRYPKTFFHVYYIEDGMEKIKIPSLLIENFVENAIKYGISPDKEMELLIIVRKEEDTAAISIVDNGNGMSEERLGQLKREEMIQDRTGNHIGIWNVRRRLKMIYGDRFQLSISSKLGEGTQVWMKVPLSWNDC